MGYEQEEDRKKIIEKTIALCVRFFSEDRIKGLTYNSVPNWHFSLSLSFLFSFEPKRQTHTHKRNFSLFFFCVCLSLSLSVGLSVCNNHIFGDSQIQKVDLAVLFLLTIRRDSDDPVFKRIKRQLSKSRGSIVLAVAFYCPLSYFAADALVMTNIVIVAHLISLPSPVSY